MSASDRSDYGVELVESVDEQPIDLCAGQRARADILRRGLWILENT